LPDVAQVELAHEAAIRLGDALFAQRHVALAREASNSLRARCHVSSSAGATIERTAVTRTSAASSP